MRTAIRINGEIHHKSEIISEEDYNYAINEWQKSLRKRDMHFAGDAIVDKPQRLNLLLQWYLTIKYWFNDLTRKQGQGRT